MKKVLSVDGGGIRGEVPAANLADFEAQVGLPCAQIFDLIAGTSTGGILAAGLAHSADGKTPTYSAAQLAALYVDHGAEIFHRAWYEPLAALHVKYPSTGLHNVLRKYYGDVTLSKCATNVLITAFDQANWTPKLFKSSKAKLDPAEDYPLWFAAQATASAPTYFPNLEGLVDGGMLGATNPAMIALTEARIMWPGEEIFLLSLGTGYRDSRVDGQKSAGWGQLEYLKSLVAMFLAGPEKIVERMVSESLGENYIRIQGLLADSGPDDAMDNASAGNLQALIQFAGQMRVHCQKDWQRAIEICKQARAA